MSDSNKRTELAQMGEFGLIKHITSQFKNHQDSTLKGIGDDAAILDPQGKQVVVSTDMLVEGIHFDLAYIPLKHLGYKAAAVNISDICAMNARCSQITVSIALTNRFSVEAVQELYEGIRAACDAHGVDLVGGDTVSSLKGLVISVTAIGFAEPADIVYRSGAQVGDIVCVTGDLGGAYVGLQLLEREKRIFAEHPTIQPDLSDSDYIINRQLKPEPRTDIVAAFKQAQLVPTSMIDVSDGLTSEITHICKASGTGVLLEEALIPLHPQTYEKAALEFKIDPMTAALHGGEDYELLFTIHPADAEKIKYMMDVKIIGEILPASEGIRLQTKSGNFHNLNVRGWTHFDNS
jgi:thiamine-monophosphate kinase